MRTIRIYVQFAALMMLFLVIACTPTKFSTTLYKDTTYSRRPQRFLVINTYSIPETRRILEDTLVMGLKDRGIDAVVSYPVIPDLPVPDEDVVKSLAKEAGADTILIIRYVNRDIDDLGLGTSLYVTYINSQIDVYDMKSNKQVFSASAETRIKNGEPLVPQFETYVRNVINMLSQEGLL